MIDLHTHVLPGIDDGPRDMVGSVAMAARAAECGTRTLVATPHIRHDWPNVHPAQIRELAIEVNRTVREHGIDLFVMPGGEVDLATGIDMDDEQLRLVTLGGNGRDLLVETPYGPLPTVFEDLLARLGERGFRLTLGHPELNWSFQHDHARLGRIAESGILIQVTARSLAAARGSRARTLAADALKNGWVHVIASDGHSADWRPPDLKEGADAARRAVGEEEVEWMVRDAPLAIVEGRDLPERPERTRGAGRFAFLRRG